MYLHEKNNQFRHYLKGKVEFTEPEINFSKIPAVTEKTIESNLEPRVIQRQLISAAGSASLRNRGQSVGQHVIIADDFTIPENNKKTRMGYL